MIITLHFIFSRIKCSFGHVIHHSDMIFDGNGWYDIRIKQQKFALVSIQKYALCIHILLRRDGIKHKICESCIFTVLIQILIEWKQIYTLGHQHEHVKLRQNRCNNRLT